MNKYQEKENIMLEQKLFDARKLVHQLRDYAGISIPELCTKAFINQQEECIRQSLRAFGYTDIAVDYLLNDSKWEQWEDSCWRMDVEEDNFTQEDGDRHWEITEILKKDIHIVFFE